MRLPRPRASGRHPAPPASAEGGVGSRRRIAPDRPSGSDDYPTDNSNTRRRLSVLPDGGPGAVTFQWLLPPCRSELLVRRRLPPPVRDPVARLPRLAADPDRCRGGMSPRGREASIERARSKPQTYVLQSVEQRPQFVAKARELSTKAHQRCHCHNVSPAPGKVALSDRCHALRAQLRLLSHQSGAGRGGYADANGLPLALLAPRKQRPAAAVSWPAGSQSIRRGPR